MSKLKTLTVAFLSIVLGASTITGVSLTLNEKPIEVSAASKTSPTSTRAILWEDNWTKASNGMYIYYWGGSTPSNWDTKPKMISTGVTNDNSQLIYYYNIPSDTTWFLIYYKTDNQQTPDIAISTFSSNNCGYWEWNNGVKYKTYSCTSVTRTITYNSNFDSETIEESFAVGKQYKVLGSQFTRQGYAFKEWNSKPDGTGTTYKPDDTFYTPYENLTLYAIWTQETYEINEYRVLDGVLQQTPFKTSNQAASYVPTQPDYDGYLSKGIFSDSKCLEEFVGPITGPTSLYHLYESEQYDYIYLRKLDNSKWSDGSEPSSVHLYVWNTTTDTKFNGAWPGNAITLSDYECEGVNFDGQGLYRIPFVINGDEVPTHFIISTKYGDNKAKQTVDLTIYFGNYYYINSLIKNDGENSGGDPDGSSTVGAQASLAWEINELRLSKDEEYSYENKTYTQSICSFTIDEAQDIVDKYEQLEKSNEFNSTLFWTNNVNNRPGDNGVVQASADYTGSEIITSLRAKLTDTQSLYLNKLVLGFDDNMSVQIILIVVSVVTLSFAIILISKKKRNASR